MDESVVDLKLNGSLIDPNFDGYKLSLDSLPVYRANIDSGVYAVKLSDAQYSYQHAKAFGVHNHLYLDQWNTLPLLFFVDEQWRVMKKPVSQEDATKSPTCVFQIPDASRECNHPDCVNVTMHFTDPNWLLLSDGSGKLFLINTSDRQQNHDWKVCLMEEVLGADKPFTLLHSVLSTNNEQHSIDCVLLHVDKNEQSEPSFTTVLEWLTLSSGESGAWSVERVRRLTGFCPPDYVSLATGAGALLLASQMPFSFSFDSIIPVQAKAENKSIEDVPPAYKWSQTLEEVCVQWSVPDHVSKSDVLFELTCHQVELGVKNGETLLKGQLHSAVDVQSCTWTLQDQHQLELQLIKQEPGMWPVVVNGDTRGHMITDPAQATEIQEKMADLVSDTMAPEGTSGDERKAYNSQQLEECDAFPPDSSVLLRLDGDSHQITHQVHLDSNQWLFNVQPCRQQQACFCLRHDVDGVIWQPVHAPKTKQAPCQHTATFNAFGYVQASKQQRKYCMCPSDFSYVLISDPVRHIYIYRQPSRITAPLRNRKTGREVAAIAKQQLISLEGVDEVVGIQATKEWITCLTHKTIYCIRVETE